MTGVKTGGKLADRTFCFANFEALKDCLFRLPRTELSLEAKEGPLVVSNRGKVPAVAINVSRPGHVRCPAVPSDSPHCCVHPRLP